MVVASITSCRALAEQDQQSDKETNRQNPLTHPAKMVDVVQTVDVSGGILAAVGIISTHRCRFLTPVYARLRAPLQPEQV